LVRYKIKMTLKMNLRSLVLLVEQRGVLSNFFKSDLKLLQKNDLKNF